MATASTVLILGASRGLGLAMAEEWLKRDAKVIATQRTASRDLSGLQGRYPGSLEIQTVDIAEGNHLALNRRQGLNGGPHFGAGFLAKGMGFG